MCVRHGAETRKDMPEKSWGVIYCPKDGKPGKTERRWRKIRACLDAEGVSYDFVQSDGPEAVGRLAAMMTRNGYRTIVVVGGDSALNRALCGVMETASPDGRHPALGVIPNGYGNDFARFWGIDANDYRAAIATLARHRLRRVDVGAVTVGREDGTEERLFFLNCCNIGAASAVTALRRKTRRRFFFRGTAYLLSSLLLLFQRMGFRFAFSMSGESHERHGMTLCIGSSRSYGLTPSAVPFNGLLDVTLVSKPMARQLLHGLWLLYTGRFLSHRGISVWRTRHILVTSTGRAPVSLDGRVLRRGVKSADVAILPEEIDFVIPE